jgi:DNA-binding MarR family transcriptional regulator
MVDQSRKTVEPDRTKPDLAILVVAAYRAVIRCLMAAMEEAGIPEMRPAYGFVIRAVAAEQPTIGRLAAMLDTTKQNASKLVDGMVAHRLLDRVVDPEDARRTRLRLAAKGQRVMATALAASEAMEAELEAVVGPAEVRAFRRGLTALVERDGTIEDVAARRARPVW